MGQPFLGPAEYVQARWGASLVLSPQASEEYLAAKTGGFGEIVLGGVSFCPHIVCVQILCVCVHLLVLEPGTADAM